MKRILSLLLTLATLCTICLSCSHQHSEKCALDFAPAKCPKCDSAGRKKCVCLEKFKFQKSRDSIYGKDDKGRVIKVTDENSY